MKRRSEGTEQGESESHEKDVSHESSEPASRRPRGRVTLFAAWCKGCGLCIEFCPQDVFVKGERGAPVVEHEDRCSACGWCVTHCPDMAIAVRRLAPDELAELEELHELAEQGALPSGED